MAVRGSVSYGMCFHLYWWHSVWIAREHINCREGDSCDGTKIRLTFCFGWDFWQVSIFQWESLLLNRKCSITSILLWHFLVWLLVKLSTSSELAPFANPDTLQHQELCKLKRGCDRGLEVTEQSNPKNRLWKK